MSEIDTQWFYKSGGGKLGPITGGELRDKIASGKISTESLLVWRYGMDAWRPALEVTDLLPDGFVQAFRSKPEKTAVRGGARWASAWNRWLSYCEANPSLATIIAGVSAIGFLRAIWLLVLWIFFAPRMCDLEGSVTCDGVPLSDGTVILEPVQAKGVSTRSTQVRDGRFKFQRKHGVTRGVEYIVRVEGYRETGRTYPDSKPGEASKEYEQFVVPECNKESIIRAEISSSLLRQGLQVDVRGKPKEKG